MEEILNDYHARSAALTTASANSRSASTDQKAQLKQETIAELNAAGYSAYDVNPASYNDLEETLQTDFSQMGLDPNGSYIIVISGEEGEEEEEKPANGARDATLPPHLYDPDNPTTASFFYKKGNKTYIMRFFTVVANNQEDQVADETIRMSDSSNSNWLEDFLTLAIEVVGLFDPTMLSTFIGAGLGFTVDDIPPLEWIEYTAIASWDITYTQIYVDSNEKFESFASVDRVYVDYEIRARYYDETAGSDSLGGYVTRSTGDEYGIMYSEHYDDENWQKAAAAEAFEDGLYDFDEIRYVEVAFYEPGTTNVIVDITLTKPS